MACRLCEARKARRACPALGESICSVCCGTKRQRTIACTPDCPHLTAAREHPASSVRHQRDRDVAELLPTIEHLTERNRQLYFLLQTVIVSHEPSGLARLIDADVAEAATAAAATIETEARGVIYEHLPTSPSAQQLSASLRRAIEDARQQGVTIYSGEAVLVLRAIAEGARRGAAQAGSSGYIGLVRRLLGAPEPSLGRERAAGGSIILP